MGHTDIIQFTLGISNGFILRGERTILLDAGCEGGAAAFAEICAKHGVEPSDISLIIVSHGHVDHYTNIKEIKELTGAQVMCHRLAAETLTEGRRPIMVPRNALGEEIWAATLEHDPVPVVTPVTPEILIDAETPLKPYGISGKLILTPGHSPCSLTLLLDTGEAFVGDLILASPISGNPEIAWFADDEPALFNSVNGILSEATVIYSGHGGPYSVQEIKKLLDSEPSAEAK